MYMTLWRFGRGGGIGWGVPLASWICWTCAAKAYPLPESPKSTWNTKLLSQGLFSLQTYELSIPVTFGYIHWWIFSGFHKVLSCFYSMPMKPTTAILASVFSNFRMREDLVQNEDSSPIPGYPDTWLYPWTFSEPPFYLYKPVSHVNEAQSWSPSQRARPAQAASTHIARAHTADHAGLGELLFLEWLQVRVNRFELCILQLEKPCLLFLFLFFRLFGWHIT